MKQRIVRILACLLLVTLFTGCNGGLFDPEYAITAPTDGIYQGVYDAVRQAVGKDIVLKYPAVQGLHTAYYPWDMDGDGTKEVLVFYQLSSKGGMTRVHLLKQGEDEWLSLQDLDSVGSDIMHVDLCDLDGDGASELCIGWSVATTNAHHMSVYQSDNGLLVQRAAEEYSQYVICDINNDRVQDLGLAVLSAETKTSALRFYTLKEGVFTLMGSIGLDGNVISYEKITAAGITAQNTGVYLDVYKGTDSMITELVYFKGGKLYNPFAGGDDNVNIATLRYCNLQSTDINQDGVIEIPFMVQLPGYDSVEEDRDITHYTIDWRYWGGNLSDTVASWFYNTRDGYYLELDSSWKNKFTVMYDVSLKAYVFYYWKGDSPGVPLVALRTFEAGSFVEGEYQKLAENETTVWGASILANHKELPVNYQKLKENFHLILE